MSRLELNYVMKLELIDKNSMKTFYVNEEERRNIRIGKVKQIASQFEKSNTKEQHFDSPFVANEVNGIKRIIDGNHRIEAIKEQIAKDPSFSIKVWVATYRDLNRDEERVIYSKWNKGTPENATDYLKWHFKTIPMGKYMLEKLPATIYGSEKTLQIKLLVGSHVNAKKQRLFEGGYSFGGERTVADFRELKKEDIDTIYAFCKDMEEVFLPFVKGSPYYRSTPLQAFYRIWFDNKTTMPKEKFIKAFKDVIKNRWGLFEEASTHGGRTATVSFYKQIISHLKLKYGAKNKFKSDEEILHQQRKHIDFPTESDDDYEEN